MKDIIRKETIEKKKLIYKSPLPRKTQRCTHYKGRAGNVKKFTEDEIFLYLMRKCKRSFKIQTN